MPEATEKHQSRSKLIDKRMLRGRGGSQHQKSDPSGVICTTSVVGLLKIGWIWAGAATIRPGAGKAIPN